MILHEVRKWYAAACTKESETEVRPIYDFIRSKVMWSKKKKESIHKTIDLPCGRTSKKICVAIYTTLTQHTHTYTSAVLFKTCVISFYQ